MGRALNHSYACLRHRTGARALAYRSPRCPTCSEPMVRIDRLPARGDDKGWRRIRVMGVPGKAKPDPLPEPPPFDRPGKRKGMWLTLAQVAERLNAEGIDTAFNLHFTATTRRSVDGILLYYRPALERIIHELKAHEVEKALGGRP